MAHLSVKSKFCSFGGDKRRFASVREIAHILKNPIYDKEKPKHKGSYQDNSRQNLRQYSKTGNSE